MLSSHIDADVISKYTVNYITVIVGVGYSEHELSPRCSILLGVQDCP
jgi:hypothetical protein